MKKKILRVLSLLLISSFHVSYSYLVVQGPGEQFQTFTHPISTTASTYNSDAQSSLFVATNKEGAGEYAIARVGTYYTFTEPLTPKKITLNDEKDVDNPLYNAAIAHLALLMGNRLIMVPEKEPVAYLLENITSFRNLAMARTEPLRDALGNQASKIVGAGGTGAPQELFYSFFAVAPEQGVFGDQGSGIAVAVPYEVKVEEVNPETNEKKEKIKKAYGQLGGQQNEFPLELRAVRFDCESDCIKIGNKLAGLGTIVAMHWNTWLSALYIGLQTTAGDQSDDGARAIVVGYVTKDKQLKLHAIADESVFTTGLQQEIVGSKGAATCVAIHGLKNMHTSTSLDYLIIHGGNQIEHGNTKRAIYALPLVNLRTERGAPAEEDMTAHGQIAHKNAIPEDLYSNISSNNVFLGRRIKKVASQPQDIYLADDVAVQVGGGQLPYGDISDVIVQDDVVFVAVAQADKHHLPGIFYSRALFDEYGRIKAWSTWARAASITDPVWGIKYNNMVGSFIALTSLEQEKPQTIVQTTWSDGQEHGLKSLVDLISHEFPQEKAGVHGLFDFPMQSPGLANRSIMVATGLKKVMLIESDVMISDYSESHVVRANDTIPSIADSIHAVVCTGSELDGLNAITHATMVATADDIKIVVAGSRGLAVLCNEQGQGWPVNRGQLPSFENLKGMRFKKIGDYSFVRKIIADEQYLYVLTDKYLDRIDLMVVDCHSGHMPVTRIAEIGETFGSKYTVFLDVVVSDKLALLATSKGLYRIGDGKDCRIALNQSDCAWTPITIKGCTMPITQVSVASTTGLTSDFAKHHGGMLYVLCGDRGSNRSKLYRFSVKEVTQTSITSQTVMPLPDVAVGNVVTHYANMGSYRNVFTTDGSLVLNAKEKEVSSKLILDGNARGNRHAIPLDLNDFSQISAFVRNSARGCWMISGDFGLRVHE
ncbi:MAG: hypothetical protein ACOYT8_06575 [Candidatus Dependentiae bacterium]